MAKVGVLGQVSVFGYFSCISNIALGLGRKGLARGILDLYCSLQ